MSAHCSISNSIENNLYIVYIDMIVYIRHNYKCSWEYGYGVFYHKDMSNWISFRIALYISSVNGKY